MTPESEAMTHGLRVDDENCAFDVEHERRYAREYLEGIEHFNARRYYDAHEIWEEIWLRSVDDTKLFYQMLVQAAVGLHHYERGNARGGRGLYHRVIAKLERLPARFMALDLADFTEQFKTFFDELIERQNEAAPPGGKPRPRIRLMREPVDD
jgi:predicted metal-dependent hydrolase